MNTDIRISVCFKNHRKRKKLLMTLGSKGVLALIDLWASAAISRPSGVLTGWDKIDISLESGWEDDPEDLVNTLVDIGFLNMDNCGVFSLHNWKKHQAWVCGADKRSEIARKAAQKRWEKEQA